VDGLAAPTSRPRAHPSIAIKTTSIAPPSTKQCWPIAGWS
jgi:hypothetical protein